MQDKVQEEIIADFEMFDDPDDRLQYLIDMADDDELRSTRKRINKMIASVDKCLATLKVE